MSDTNDGSASDLCVSGLSAQPEASRQIYIWNRPAVRMVLVCVGLMIAQGAIGLLTPREPTGLEDLTLFPMWCVVAWIAMQGPRRYVAMVGGSVYLVFMVVVLTWLQWRYRPDMFGNWDTYWKIDLPIVFWLLVKGLVLFRLASMFTGLEIVGTEAAVRPRWGIRRWLLLMAVIAIGIQVLVAETNWMVDLAGIPFDNSVGPPAVNPLESARGQWLLFLLVSLPLIPILPVSFSAWIFAGKRWRLALFPLFGLLTILHLSGVEALLEQVQLQSVWFRSLGVATPRNWLLVGILETIAYGFAASLIPWLGLRWIDYWTPVSILLPVESSSKTILDQNEIPKTKNTER